MSGDDGKVIDINRAQEEHTAAIRLAKDGLPFDMAKLAVWRKGQQAPITFVVQDVEGKAVQRIFAEMVNGGSTGLIQFSSYDDGTGGRLSHSTFDVDDVVGLTLEYAPEPAADEVQEA